jgi:hypothetical protein
MEVIEHLDPPRLPALVRTVFHHAGICINSSCGGPCPCRATPPGRRSR